MTWKFSIGESVKFIGDGKRKEFKVLSRFHDEDKVEKVHMKAFGANGKLEEVTVTHPVEKLEVWK